MNCSQLLSVGLTLLVSINLQATPIIASTGGIGSADLVFANGGPFPDWLDIRRNNLVLLRDASANFLAPDATEFSDSEVVINGLTPETPSIFNAVASDTRNGGAEGVFASSSLNLYGGLLVETGPPDGTNDARDRGTNGGTIAQANINDPFFAGEASGFVDNQRMFSFINLSNDTQTFGVNGVFELGLLANAMGEFANANSVILNELFFSSSNPLNIQYADVAPFLLDETSVGDGAQISIERETDINSTGRLSLSGEVSAQSTNDIDFENAFGTSRMEFALGVTLLPGQTVFMSHNTFYSSAVNVSDIINEVSSPALGIGMISGLIVLMITLKKSPKKPTRIY